MGTVIAWVQSSYHYISSQGYDHPDVRGCILRDFSLFSHSEIIKFWMNNFGFNFELSIELTQFLAQFKVKVNTPNVLATPMWQ